MGQNKQRITSEDGRTFLGIDDLGNVKTTDGGPGRDIIQGDVVTSADASAGVDLTDAPTLPTSSIILDDLLISSSIDQTITVRSKTSHTAIATFYLAAYLPIQLTFRNGLRCPDAGEAIQMVALAGNIAAVPSYHEE